MYSGFVLTAAAQGSSPGLGPFAASHSPSLSLTLFPVMSWAVLWIEKKKTNSVSDKVMRKI